MTFRDEIIQDVSCALAKWNAYAILRCSPRTPRLADLDRQFSVNAATYAKLTNKTLPMVDDIDPFTASEEMQTDFFAHLP